MIASESGYDESYEKTFSDRGSGFLIKFIDQILTFAETYLVYLMKRIIKKVYFFKGHHGFRRSLKEFKEIWIDNKFEFQSIYEDLFEVDYDRLRIIQKLKVSGFLSKIFLKSNPYLNIIIFKKI